MDAAGDVGSPDPGSLLELVVNSLPVVVYAFDAQGSVLLSEGHALTGMDSAAGAAVGRSVFDVFGDEPEVHEHLRRALAGEAHVANLRLRRNGRMYRVWFTPRRDDVGQVAMVTGLSLDVTEARQADRELRAAVASLETIQDHLPIAIFRVDAAGTVTLARGSILPAGAQESIGRPLAEAYSHYPELVSKVEEARRGRDQNFSMSDGVRHFDFYLRSLHDGETGQGVIGVIIEVTEQRRAAAAALEAEWRTRFVSEINHELRTPLNSVLGFAELLTRPEFDPLTERQQRYVDNILKSGRHLLGLVNELLDVSKVRAGHVDVVREPVDSSSQLQDVVERMMPVAEAKGILLKLGRRSPRPAAGDARRIQQVLLNLVANAVKFTAPGGSVTLKSYQRHGVLKLEVSDTGIGIPRRHQELLFEDFLQLDAGRSVGVGGTGLGLALSRRLVRAMGGELTFRSSVGRGSTFVVSLPVWREPS